MSNWTRVRFEAEEVSLSAAWVDGMSDDELAALNIVERSGEWRPTERLDVETPTTGGDASSDSSPNTSADTSTDASGQNVGDDLGGWGASTVPELREEIDRRNQGRQPEDQLAKSGKKAELVAALDADDDA